MLFFFPLHMQADTPRQITLKISALILKGCCLSLPVENAMEMCQKQSLDLFSSQKIPDVYREHSKLSGCKRLSEGQVHCFCPWTVSRAAAHLSQRASLDLRHQLKAVGTQVVS